MRVLVRADAAPDVGAGHLMRCLALMQALKERGGSALFVLSSTARALELRIQSEGFESRTLEAPTAGPEDLDHTLRIARQWKPDRVVIDGYRFPPGFQREIREGGWPLLAIDDFGTVGEYFSHAILDQNLSARPEDYRRRPEGTRLLLGTQFALLRREFRSREIPAAESRTARRLLVTLGGSAPEPGVRTCLGALGRITPPLDGALVLLGPLAASPSPPLAQAIAQMPPRYRVLGSSPNMAEEMAMTDLCVSAGGSTCWELAFMGVPAAIVTLGRDQEPNAQALEDRGAALCLGPLDRLREEDLARTVESLLEDPIKRQSMSQAGRRLVDGRGADRVLAALEDCA